MTCEFLLDVYRQDTSRTSEIRERDGPLNRCCLRAVFAARLVGVDLGGGVSVDDVVLDGFCTAHGIQRLSVFGSALRGELRPDSDIDLLVEFQPGRTPGLLGIAQLELELTELVGRPVDLRTRGDLSRYFRDEVVATARTLYDAA